MLFFRFARPVPLAALRLRNITADLARRQVHQPRAAVIALVHHHFFDACRMRLPGFLLRGVERLHVTRRIAAIGRLTLNVIPKKVKDEESEALTTPLCITASPEEIDRDLAAQLREFTDVH